MSNGTIDLSCVAGLELSTRFVLIVLIDYILQTANYVTI